MKKGNDYFAAFGLTASIGLNMAACLAAGGFLGHLADSYLSTSPWGMAVGIVFGALAGLWATYKKIKEIDD